jgi:nicotinate-nucleotide adenylyltransferase
MVELAIQGDSRFSLSRVDLDRAGPHYTVDALKILAVENAPCELFLLIGGDSLRDITTWRDPASVVAQAQLVVLKRPEIAIELLDHEQSIPGLSSRTIVLDAPQVDISSSIARKMIRTGQSTRYLIPDAVREYIYAESLYIGDRSDRQ